MSNLKYLDVKYKTIFIKSGELAVTYKPVIVWTVLGSCVSVVLFSKKTKTGAICHAQYPDKLKQATYKCTDSCPAPCSIKPCKGTYLFARESIEFMLAKLEKMGIKKNELEAKIFGGANVLRFNINKEQTVGHLNVQSAMATLRKHKIRISDTDIGGKHGRTIYYYSDTGEIKIKNHGKEISRGLEIKNVEIDNSEVLINPIF